MRGSWLFPALQAIQSSRGLLPTWACLSPHLPKRAEPWSCTFMNSPRRRRGEYSQSGLQIIYLFNKANSSLRIDERPSWRHWSLRHQFTPEYLSHVILKQPQSPHVTRLCFSLPPRSFYHKRCFFQNVKHAEMQSLNEFSLQIACEAQPFE